MVSPSIINIPFTFANQRHKTPVILTGHNTQWAVFGDDDKYYNAYPQYLIELFNRSAKHRAIINGKVNYIFGKGTELNSPINQEELLNDLLRKVIFDFELFDGFALELIYGKGGLISDVRMLDFAKVRLSIDGKKVFYSDKWDTVTKPSSNQIVEYNQWTIDCPKVGAYVLYTSAYRPNKKIYPFPSYLGAVPYIETDIEIGNFHLNNIKNQFWGGQMVTFFSGVPTEEEKAEVERQMKKKFSGTDNAGRFVLTFADSKDRGVEVQSLTPSDLDKQFMLLNEQVQQELFIAHQIPSPMLFGIKTAGQLGGRTELIEANELFKNVYVQNRVDFLETIFNKLLPLTTCKTKSIKLISTDPIKEIFTEQTLVGVMTKDEIRSAAGLPVLNIQDPNNPTQQGMTNDAVRSLTGRQHQQLLRIIRQYGQGKLTLEAAKTLLKTGLGLGDSDIVSLLGEQQFSSQKLIDLFKNKGESADKYEVIKQNFHFDEHSEVDELLKFATSDLTSLDKKVLSIISKDKKIDTKALADSLGVKVSDIETSISSLRDLGLIKGTSAITVTSQGSSVLDGLPMSITTMKIMYSYEVKPDVDGGLIIPTTREFCREIIGMSKMFSLADIQRIGIEWGYDVFKYTGGFYHNPKSDETTPTCRHQWVMNIVKEKKTI